MTWRDLAFLHWPVEREALRSLVPSALRLESFDKRAWLGITPFRMSGVRPRALPPLPGVSAFPELNVRTYVEAGGKPGVWFFSLDAGSRIAVRVARLWFGLPYYDARMRASARGVGVEYRSERIHRGAPGAELAASYAPTGPAYRSAPGELDNWLTERYCLYALDRGGRLRRGEIHHAPWPLQPAEADLRANTMPRPLGIRLPDAAPLVHFARHLEVVAWSPRPAAP